MELDSKHAPSLLPEGRKWELVWHDEFDGPELDRTKWDFRQHLLQQRHNTFSTDDGIEFDGNSNLLMKLYEKDGHFYSPHLQTGSNYLDRPGSSFCFDDDADKPKMVWPVAKIQEPRFMHRYGYYECRCKLQTQPGWWSAFWLQSPVIGSSLNPEEAGVEVDIMENFTRDGVVLHNNHWSGYGEDHQSLASGERHLEETPDGFHVFGLEWTPDEYVYYIDGKESWRVSGPVSQREQFILISTECNGYRNGNEPAEELKQAVLPDYFMVDYIRVYDEVK
jgi:beta-glucanase (GH16 family)